MSTPTLTPIALLESLLFVSSVPIPLSRLAKAIRSTSKKTRQLLTELDETLQNRGLRLQWDGNEVQMTTAPEASEAIETFMGLEVTTRLSPAALEVLAITAYMQPVTRPRIDHVRGVNSDGALRTLLSKGLVAEIGRLETPGRPILYGTTADFLQYFGLGSLDDLPAYEEDETEEE